MQDISSRKEREQLTTVLMEFMADFVDNDSPIYPCALVDDPRNGEEVTFGDMFRAVRLSRY